MAFLAFARPTFTGEVGAYGRRATSAKISNDLTRSYAVEEACLLLQFENMAE